MVLTAEKPVIVESSEELLFELLRYAEPFRKEDFDQLPSGVYVRREPWKSTKPVVLKTQSDQRSYVNDRNVIIRLHRIEQEQFHNGLSEKEGVPLRHGALVEWVEVAYSPEGQATKQNVLIPYWVFTREINGPDGVYQTVGKKTPEQPRYQLVSQGRLLIPVPQQATDLPHMELGAVVQTDIPTKTGYFSQFKGAIPTDKELRSERTKDTRGRWNGVYPDEYGYSAVGCGWNSDGQGLYAYAGRPLGRVVDGALGTFAERPS